MTISATSTIEKTKENTQFEIFQYGKKIRPLTKEIISIPEKIILWDLSDRFGKNGRIYPSNLQVSNSTGLPYKTVLNCLSDLKSKKFINYEAQHNRNRRYIDLYDPELAAYNLMNKIDKWGSLLVPKLSLVRDSGIPGQGHSYNRTQQGKRTTTPKTPLRIIKSSSSQKSDIVAELKNRILKESLKNDFNNGTYKNLKGLGLSDGQIKTLIDLMNKSTAKGCGWLDWQAKDLGNDKIADFDLIIDVQKNKLEKEKQITIEADKQKEMKVDGYASGAQMMRNEVNRVKKGKHKKADIQKRQSLNKSTSIQNLPINPQKSPAFKEQEFEEIRIKFLESIAFSQDLLDRYINMADHELREKKEFINYVNRSIRT